MPAKYPTESRNSSGTSGATRDGIRSGGHHEDSFAVSAGALSEIAQAKIRNWIHIVVVLLAIIAAKFDGEIEYQKVILTAVVGIPAGMLLYYWATFLHKHSLSYSWRLGQRCASMVSDIFFITWVLHLGGTTFAGLFVLYIWISVGYGLRYGINYLYATIALSASCFTLATWYTPFWRDNPGLFAGMLFGLLVVPAYVGWLIKQLQKAVAEKDIAYRAKSDFVAMMSHELRTPLHGIISTSDMLRSTASSPKQKEMIRIISTSSRTLLELINRVLDISKFESKSIALKKQSMDLHEVVNDTANIMWPQAFKKGLSLHVYIDPDIQNFLEGAPHQLQEVLINLCGNAVKFTETGHVAMRVLADSETDNSVTIRFEISDTGPGIPKEALADIFEPFVQSDSPLTRKHGGTGLGTAFAKELIRLMGGEISVESTEGVGTKFTIKVELLKLEDRNKLAQLYPFTVAAIGFKQGDAFLTDALFQFGTRIKYFESPFDLSKTPGGEEHSSYPDAIFVNADKFADNLRGVIRTATSAISDQLIPMFAYGDEQYKSSAIAAGYSSYVTQNSGQEIVGRTLNMISALCRESTEQNLPAIGSVTGLHILVAEDNKTNQRIAQLVLEDAGHRCTVVANGDEALDALHDNSYDLAILDMHMPHRDGIEVAKIYNFSHFDEASRIPLIMMTADDRAEAREEAVASGIDAFVTKPITPKQLIHVIDSLVAEHDITSEDSTDIPESGAEFIHESNTGAASPVTPIGAKSLNMLITEDLMSYMNQDECRIFFEEFIADGSEYISTLASCDTLDKVSRAKNDMHAFAGACMVIGAEELAREARRIEQLESETILENRDDLHIGITSLFDHATQDLREIFRSSSVV